MRILLLRQEEENDKYRNIFQTHGYDDVTQIPALEFAYCNKEQFKQITHNLHDYSGLIFTSKRAIDAFRNVVDEDVEKMREENYLIYVVGTSCESRLQELGLHSVGGDTGNANELATLITSQYHKHSKPLIFPCGNLARETIPKRLKEANIPLEPIICYTTVANSNFVSSLKECISDGGPQVIVFFSPSGAQFHMNDIEKLIVDFENVNIVCIGRTTEAAILKLGKRVDGVAEKPNPTALIEIINSLSKPSFDLI